MIVAYVFLGLIGFMGIMIIIEEIQKKFRRKE